MLAYGGGFAFLYDIVMILFVGLFPAFLNVSGLAVAVEPVNIHNSNVRERLTAAGFSQHSSSVRTVDPVDGHILDARERLTAAGANWIDNEDGTYVSLSLNLDGGQPIWRGGAEHIALLKDVGPIRRLDISDVSLDDVIAQDSFSEIEELRELHIVVPHALDVRLVESLSRCKMLETLDIYVPSITEGALEPLARLDTLTDLRLSTIRAAHERDVSYICQIRSLQRLSLFGANVNVENLDLFLSLDQLTYLRIQSRQVISRESRQSFLERHPTCTRFFTN